MNATNQVPSTLIAGGNEVFFSFLESLLSMVEGQVIPEDLYREMFRRWGARIATRSGFSGTLPEVLENVAHTLSILGLVRVFEPAGEEEGALRILVLRCLTSRYVAAACQPNDIQFVNIVAPMVEGLLKAAGHDVRVSETREGMLRPDEYYLLIHAGG